MSALATSLGLGEEGKLLSKATADGVEPTPGYVLDDVAKLTQRSADHCKQVEDFLLKKLESSSAHVKLKALRNIKYCIERGHSSFRQRMNRSSDKIRNLSAFRGADDELHGDALSRAIRDAAGEILQMVFGTSSRADEPASFQSGMGPTSYSSATSFQSGAVPVVGVPVKSGMTGFGSNNYSGGAQPAGSRSSTGGGIMESMSSAVGRVREGFGSSSAMDKYGGDNNVPRSGGFRSSTTEDSRLSMGGGAYGGTNGAGSGFTASTRPVADSSRGGWGPNAGRPAETSAPSAQGLTLGQETRLVDEITDKSGVRTSPSREALAQFVQRCVALDQQKIAELLEDKLEATQAWQTRLKALCTIEACIRAGLSTITNFFAEDDGAISEQITTASQASIKTRAEKVLRLLRGSAVERDDDDDGGRAEAPRSDLLMGVAAQGNGAVASPNTLFQGKSYDGPADGGASLFAGLRVSDQPPPPSPSSLFGGLETRPSPAAQTSAGLFDGLSMAPGPQQSAGGPAGLFSGLTVSTPAVPVAPNPETVATPESPEQEDGHRRRRRRTHTQDGGDATSSGRRDSSSRRRTDSTNTSTASITSPGGPTGSLIDFGPTSSVAPTSVHQELDPLFAGNARAGAQSSTPAMPGSGFGFMGAAPSAGPAPGVGAPMAAGMMGPGPGMGPGGMGGFGMGAPPANFGGYPGGAQPQVVMVNGQPMMLMPLQPAGPAGPMPGAWGAPPMASAPGGSPAMPYGQYGAPYTNSPYGQVSGAPALSPQQPASKPAASGFGFVDSKKKADSFDFVSDVMRASK